MIDNFEIELSGIKYQISGTKKFTSGTEEISFKTIVNDKEVTFKCTFTKVLFEDLQTIFGLDPIEELTNIIKFEIKAELFEIVYNASFKAQCGIASQCSTDEELFEVSTHDSVFAAWLFNFDGDHT